MAQNITVNSRGEPSLYQMTKDKDDVLTLIYDFGLYFGSDTASTLTVTPDSGLTVDSSSVAANKATITLSGGSDSSVYDLKVKLAGTTETKQVVTQIMMVDGTKLTPDYGLYV
jgi:hypothetical protein